MNNEQTDVASNESSKRGRPAIAKLESVERAVEELKSQNARVSVRGIMRILGGSPKKISELLKQLPDTKPLVDAVPTVPDALTKLWKSSVAEYIRSVLEECQQKLEAAAQVIRTKVGEIHDLEARVIELEAALGTTSTERDLAFGERDQLRELIEEVGARAAANLERAEKASVQEALARLQAEDMAQRAQRAEIRASELERSMASLQQRLSGAEGENQLLRGQIDGFLHHEQAKTSQVSVRAGRPGPPPLPAVQFDDDDVPF